MVLSSYFWDTTPACYVSMLDALRWERVNGVYGPLGSRRHNLPVYSPLALSDIGFRPFLQLAGVVGQIIGLVVYRSARYQTLVQNLSIDNGFSLCDIEAGSDGSGAGGSAARQ